ncbi:hypothetical protein SS50377_27002 [Spironucleus salmonicida]|uniref:Uncharacterized protein n=1 Tax=Spironucleus salmonicida TaxID=348837 RepID=V6M2M9_9EUKA|nr:hypothetical protein SS50377_27002 [Spironucleus salmonicida]|eukprot:EST47514.1 Hypothetical protein SS50377_12499 [Spironucleus salmonicida]
MSKSIAFAFNQDRQFINKIKFYNDVFENKEEKMMKSTNFPKVLFNETRVPKQLLFDINTVEYVTTQIPEIDGNVKYTSLEERNYQLFEMESFVQIMRKAPETWSRAVKQRSCMKYSSISHSPQFKQNQSCTQSQMLPKLNSSQMLPSINQLQNKYQSVNKKIIRQNQVLRTQNTQAKNNLQ